MKITAKKIVLISPLSNAKSLDQFVEECLNNQVLVICGVGEGCREIEDHIDELIVGDGSDQGRFIATTSHPNETLSDIIEFAEIWPKNIELGVRVVRL